MQYLHDVEQAIQHQKKKFQILYSYLSKTEEIARENNNQEAMRMIDLMVERIFQILLKMKLNKISPDEKVVQNLKFVVLIKNGYLLRQKAKEKLQDMTLTLEQLNQANI